MNKKNFSIGLMLGLTLIFILSLGAFNIQNLKNMFINSPFADWYIILFRQEKPFDENHVITTLDNGRKIIVNKNDKCVCWLIRIAGRWDSSELAAVKYIIRPGKNIVEVGANFGVYTLVMSELVGEAGQVIAFEPNPNVNKYLEKSIHLNNIQNVDLKKMAAGGRERVSSIIYNEKNIGGGFLTEAVADKKMNFKVVRLDDVIKLNSVDVLKIDAEGSEGEIIEGAHRIIQSNKDIILMMEWSPELLQRQGVEPIKLTEKFKKYGFNIWAIGKSKKGRPVFVPMTYEALLTTPSCDLVLSRKEVL